MGIVLSLGVTFAEIVAGIALARTVTSQILNLLSYVNSSFGAAEELVDSTLQIVQGAAELFSTEPAAGVWDIIEGATHLFNATNEFAAPPAKRQRTA